MATATAFHLRGILTGAGGQRGLLDGNVTLTLLEEPEPAPPDTLPTFTRADYEYLGCFKLPKNYGGATEWTNGGITGRRVGGVVHLLMYGQEQNYGTPILEFTDPGVYAPTPDTAVMSEGEIAWYADPWHGKRVTYRDGQLVDPVPYLSMGTILWHEERQLLYCTYGDGYNVAGYPDWNLVGLRLDAATATTEAYGPWRCEVIGSDGTIYLGQKRAAGVALGRDGALVTYGTIASGNAGSPWGPDAHRAPPATWPTASTPAGLEAPDLVVPETYLTSHAMIGRINADGRAADDVIVSGRRKLDPYLWEQPTPGQIVSSVNPALYGGMGSWNEGDGIGSPMWIERNGKAAVIFFETLTGSPSQDPTDPKAGHAWYANPGNAFACPSHRVPSPVQVTGPVSTARFPGIRQYAPADLEAVRQGLVLDYAPEPTLELNLTTEFAIVTPNESFLTARNLGGGYFDRETGKLFAVSHQADAVTAPGAYMSLVHVFRIGGA